MTDMAKTTPKAPTGLGAAGRKLWRDTVACTELSPAGLSLLEDACRETDVIARLERELRGSPTMVKGSMGQLVASPLVSELRQHRSAKAGIMRTLKVAMTTNPAAEESFTSAAARAAARARWDRAPKLKVI